MNEGVLLYTLIPFGGLLLIFTCLWLLCRRRPSFTRRGVVVMLNERRPHSMIYSVTMQDGGGSSFYNSVTEYLRNTRQFLNQSESSSDTDLRTRQRQLNGAITENDCSKQKDLPSYDDVISGNFGGNVEPPPPSYIEAVSSPENNGK